MSAPHPFTQAQALIGRGQYAEAEKTLRGALRGGAGEHPYLEMLAFARLERQSVRIAARCNQIDLLAKAPDDVGTCAHDRRCRRCNGDGNDGGDA